MRILKEINKINWKNLINHFFKTRAIAGGHNRDARIDDVKNGRIFISMKKLNAKPTDSYVDQINFPIEKAELYLILEN